MDKKHQQSNYRVFPTKIHKRQHLNPNARADAMQSERVGQQLSAKFYHEWYNSW